MKNLKIKNFKAFGDDEVEFGDETKDGKPMNILCYGENGAGKSSVFEVIKFVFHQQRLRRERHIDHLQGEQLNNALRQMRIDYLHQGATDFEIIVNKQKWENLNTEDYYVYMVSGELLQVKDRIDVRDLLKATYLGNHNIETELTAIVYNFIIEEINRALEHSFFEDVCVSKSEGGDFLLKIDDDKRGLHSDGDLHKIFNEAKLHLISLLVILSAIEIMAPSNCDVKKMLVLDDFITSLDMANRSFLYQYIISKFDNYQKVIFTHNTSFYNLCDFFIGEDARQKDKWVRQGIFEYNHKHMAYSDSRLDSADKLSRRLKDHPGELLTIGNAVRQYFEVLLHKLSMLLMAGAKEETVALLSEISRKADRRYFHIEGEKIKSVKDLTDSIMNTLDNVNEERQIGIIRKYVSKYRAQQDTDKLSENLKAMTIYQKVALHQSSHGHEGLPGMSSQEIKASIVLLRKLEETIKKLKVERI